MKIDFKYLFKPIKVKTIIIPNRIVFPPVNTSYATREGAVTQRLINFHLRISEGGVGLNIVGSTAISMEGRVNYNGLRLDEDKFINGLSQLFSAIKKAGSIPGIQLMHAGRQTISDVTGMQPVAPSAIPCPYLGEMPRELKTHEIHLIVEDFGKASLRAKNAGAEIIEIHGAHGYLIGQFLSPYSNKRKDEYGGNLENRARLFCEIILEIKAHVGRDFPIICRVSADEFVQGGITLDESTVVAQMLVKAGADVISGSAGVYGSRDKIYPTTPSDQRVRVYLAQQVKKCVNAPVICSGRIGSLSMAEQILHEKKADMIAMGRALIADPKLIRKVRSGNLKAVVRCSWCNKCVYDFRKHASLSCPLNSRL